MRDREGRRADVRISDNSGDSWQTVLVVKPAKGDDLLAEDSERISALAVSSTGPRRIAAVCGRGVYLVKLNERSLAH